MPPSRVAVSIPLVGQDSNLDVSDRSPRVRTPRFLLKRRARLQNQANGRESPLYRLEVVPWPQNRGEKPLIWPRFSPFQRLGHLTAHPGAHLLRRRRPQHVPTCDFVQDHTEHAPATPHSQPLHSQPILQAAVGRLDARASRVPLCKHRGLLFPPPTSQTMGLVGELQGVAAVSSLVNRAGVAEGASPADLRRHLDPRRARFLVSLDHQRRVSLRTGFHPPGPFVHGEVVERQRRLTLPDCRLAVSEAHQ